VLLGSAPAKQSKKARQRAAKQGGTPRNKSGKITPRWRTTGLVKKDALRKVLESNGARVAS
jgi:hypothetical protein